MRENGLKSLDVQGNECRHPEFIVNVDLLPRKAAKT
jgi:hypothetical protein